MNKKLEEAAYKFTDDFQPQSHIWGDSDIQKAFLAGSSWMNEECAKVAELNTISLAQSFSPGEVGRVIASDIRALVKEEEK